MSNLIPHRVYILRMEGVPSVAEIMMMIMMMTMMMMMMIMIMITLIEIVITIIITIILGFAMITKTVASWVRSEAIQYH